MTKPLALSIALCLGLGLGGCQVFEKSAAWEEAKNVRPGDTIRDPDPSHAYAGKLHHAFASSGVEHKVVTYQYRYTTRLREEAMGTRTAVVYRDNTTGNYPWWLKDERLNTPFWLPNGSLDRQISFYLQRQVSVIEKKDYPGSHDGKDFKGTVAFRNSPASMRTMVAGHPVTGTRYAMVKNLTPLTAPGKPLAHNSPAKPATAGRFVSKPAQPQRAANTAAVSWHHNWFAPAFLSQATPSNQALAQDTSLARLFRLRNGSKYDPSSPADRRKMEILRHGLSASR